MFSTVPCRCWACLYPAPQWLCCPPAMLQPLERRPESEDVLCLSPPGPFPLVFLNISPSLRRVDLVPCAPAPHFCQEFFRCSPPNPEDLEQSTWCLGQSLPCPWLRPWHPERPDDPSECPLHAICLCRSEPGHPCESPSVLPDWSLCPRSSIHDQSLQQTRCSTGTWRHLARPRCSHSLGGSGLNIKVWLIIALI